MRNTLLALCFLGGALSSWAAPILEYDFFQAGTTTIVAKFDYNGFVSPSNLPVNGFAGFILPSVLLPCNLFSGPSSAELQCTGTGANSPAFDFNFAGGAFPTTIGAFSGSGLLIGNQSIPSLTTTALRNGQIVSATVPEPSTTVLTALGLGVMALTMRFHRRRRPIQP